MLKKMGVVVALFGMLTMVPAQPNLVDLANEAGVGWLTGEWQTVNNEGQTVLLAFKPDLDNHIVQVHYKDARSESKGMVVLDPDTRNVKFWSANNLGGVGTGAWSAEDRRAILKYKHTDADGRLFRIGLTFTRLDANQMEVKLYDLSEYGELSSEPRWTATFTRKS
ncbi:MAG: hypothetical protein M1608_10860 [Candidatus Omnitrophica bacterium]|nr:hypothetical protein [Candidatus Omnitrophota bacterium]